MARKAKMTDWGPYTVALTILEKGIEVDFISVKSTAELAEAIKVLEAFILTESRANALVLRDTTLTNDDQ